MRNILGSAGRHMRGALASRLKLVFAAEDKMTARKLAKEVCEDYEGKAAKAMECLDQGLESAIAVLELPVGYHRRLRTSNLAERVNEEIRRRQRVIRIFPNEASAERLIGAWLSDLHEQWQSGVKYFDMQEFWDWRNEQKEALEAKRQADKGASNIAMVNRH